MLSLVVSLTVVGCSGTPPASDRVATPIPSPATAGIATPASATDRAATTSTATTSPSPRPSLAAAAGLAAVLAVFDQPGVLRQAGPLQLPYYPDAIEGVWNIRGTINLGGAWSIITLVKSAKPDSAGRRLIRIVLGEDISEAKNDLMVLTLNRDDTVRAAALRVPSGGGGGLSGYLSADLLGANLVDVFATNQLDQVVASLQLPDTNAGPRAGLDHSSTLGGWKFRYLGTEVDGDWWIVTDSDR